MDSGMSFLSGPSLVNLFSCRLLLACPQEQADVRDLGRDVWEVNHRDIQLIDKLGSGMFGEVIAS